VYLVGDSGRSCTALICLPTHTTLTQKLTLHPIFTSDFRIPRIHPLPPYLSAIQSPYPLFPTQQPSRRKAQDPACPQLPDRRSEVPAHSLYLPARFNKLNSVSGIQWSRIINLHIVPRLTVRHALSICTTPLCWSIFPLTGTPYQRQQA